MNQHLEVEYKTLITKSSYAEILGDHPEAETHTQINTYFDTADHEIRKRHWMMRIRQIAQTFEFTLKIPNNAGVMEHVLMLENNTIEHPDVLDFLASLGIKGPFHIAGQSITERSSFYDEFAEISLDYSRFKSTEDYELEYELIKEASSTSEECFQALLRAYKITYKKAPAKVVRALSD